MNRIVQANDVHLTVKNHWRTGKLAIWIWGRNLVLPFGGAGICVGGIPVSSNTPEENGVSRSNDRGRNAVEFLFPFEPPGSGVEGVYVTDTIRSARQVSAHESCVSLNQGIAVKACLLAVLMNVVAPAKRTTVTVQNVEVARAGANDESVAHNCGRRKDSSLRIELPKRSGSIGLTGAV